MIYTINEARNAEEYRAEKAAREKAEQDKKDKQYNDRYLCQNKDFLFTHKIRADGHRDSYLAGNVGSRNREVGLDDGSTKIHMPDYEDGVRYGAAETVGFRNAKSSKEFKEIVDAANRNMRRHPERWDGSKPVKPKTESTVFDDVDII